MINSRHFVEPRKRQRQRENTSIHRNKSNILVPIDQTPRQNYELGDWQPLCKDGPGNQPDWEPAMPTRLPPVVYPPQQKDPHT